MHARRFDLKSLWKTSLHRCDGRRLVAERFADLSSVEGPVHVLALGKVAGPMAAGAVEVLGEKAGRVVVAGATSSGAPAGAEVHVGDHPFPGPASFAAGRALLEAADEVRARGERAAALVSGGGSALCEVPAEGLVEDDLTVLNRALVTSGAPIETINRIRRRLSALKGGGLARKLGPSLAWEGVLVDIPSGDADAVASGPCRPQAADEAQERMEVDRRTLATPRTLAKVAESICREAGLSVETRRRAVSGTPVEELGEEILVHLMHGEGLLVATGEVSVALPASGPLGRGGRAQHLALWVLQEARKRLPKGRHWSFLAAGSDGRDGEGAAGALVGHETDADEERARKALRSFAAGEAHRSMGTLLEEHPPRTNLTDLYVAWAM